MGASEPVEPVRPADTRSFLLACCGVAAVLLILQLGMILARAIRNRRLRFSLLQLLFLTLTTALVMFGAIRWRVVVADLARYDRASLDYASALECFNNANPCEKPAHRMEIEAPFYLGVTEVTEQQYRLILGRTLFSKRDAEMPACVSWNAAEDFCLRLGRIGITARLPREAEWEFACRAGTDTPWYAGNTEAEFAATAWYSENTNRDPQPVGLKLPNRFGVHDMLGNVWEWCLDWYIPYPGAGVEARRDGDKRVVRGGAFTTGAMGCRSSYRGCLNPNESRNDIGFRIVIPAARE